MVVQKFLNRRIEIVGQMDYCSRHAAGVPFDLRFFIVISLARCVLLRSVGAKS